MTMNINDLIDRAHKNALDHGFYEDKFDLARPVMLVVGEIGEALEADLKDRHANWSDAKDYYNGLRSDEYFESVVKDTFCDEIADIFIRIFSLMGHENLPFFQGDIPKSKGLYEDLRLITLNIVTGRVTRAIYRLQSLCLCMDIAIEPFILAKMKYNENRPYKHGKRFG